MISKVLVTLYTKPGCHLCEEAKQNIAAAACAEDYLFEEITIETDPALFNLYRTEIPVIFINDEEAFRYRLTSTAFRERVRLAKR